MKLNASIEKMCSKCKCILPMSEFHKDRDKLASHCRACKRAYYLSSEVKERNRHRMINRYREMSIEERRAKYAEKKKWAKDNPEQVKRYQISYQYGLSLESYKTMLSNQNGLCAVCFGKPGGKRPLAVDHDHKTGKVRGLLCYRCNRLMSLIDDPKLHENAMNYKSRSERNE